MRGAGHWITGRQSTRSCGSTWRASPAPTVSRMPAAPLWRSLAVPRDRRPRRTLLDARPRSATGHGTLLATPPPPFVISAQVIGEFYVVVTRRLARPLAADHARAAVEQLHRLPVIPVEAQLTQAAVTTCQSAQLSYADALIIEAARGGRMAICCSPRISPTDRPFARFASRTRSRDRFPDGRARQHRRLGRYGVGRNLSRFRRLRPAARR